MHRPTSLRLLSLGLPLLIACGDKATDGPEDKDSAAPTGDSGDPNDTGDPGPQDNDGDGWTDQAGDCDDNDASVFPGATEVCNGKDDNCDGGVDNSASDASRWYIDEDGDGFGHEDSVTTACDQPDGYADNDQDCDDDDAGIHPEAAEACNDIDDDCDGYTDESPTEGPRYYEDLDEDGHGNPDVSRIFCTEPTGYVESSDDCDDENDDVYGGAPEQCDGLDNDCDEDIDEDAEDATEWFVDSDADGWGDADHSQLSCDPVSGSVENDDDCDDADEDEHPLAAEVCDDEVDNDCDGATDESCDQDWIGKQLYEYGLDTVAGTRDCLMLWDATGSEYSGSLCAGCDFAFDVDYTYNSDLGMQSGSKCSSLAVDFSDAYAYRSDYYGMGESLMVEYYGWWYRGGPATYDSATGTLSFSFGVEDKYYGSGNYYTSYYQVYGVVGAD